ncbi:hypothetical protein GIB67_019635 [Kingdonia uniflora]|uniref:Uncharacterized protein n=1 Tax=Kingdonia uniflora TaxID=39325 RepID=A0A7J7N0I8_9MAGN|nr:hypothetical protein GIB67_019635 [Kingdonia uniflora]
MAELARLEDEIKRTRDHATQSWLDSKPVIDQLEKLQSDLKNAKNRGSMATIVISELESQLENTNTCIRSKKIEEQNAKTTGDELYRSLGQKRIEMEEIKLETDKERRARTKLKHELRLRRQTLRTLQLTLRAVRIESEALGASVANTHQYIKQSNLDETTVQLTHEEYYELTRRANEETSLAEWRVSVSREQKIVAEASRNEALRRMKEIYSRNNLRRFDHEITEQQEQLENEEGYQDPRIRKNSQRHGNAIRTSSVKENLQSVIELGSPRQQVRSSKCSKDKRMIKKKKPSVLHKIKRFLVRNIIRFFG